VQVPSSDNVKEIPRSLGCNCPAWDLLLQHGDIKTATDLTV
jgi:hypothetical protein